MPPTPPNQRMGELHEQRLAEANGGRKTKASGSQWHDQGDGRNAHDDPFGFCWDGKSTKGKSLTVTLDMIAKIREQAQGERPQLGLRWYGNESLTEVLEDWVAIQLADWEEVLTAARRSAAPDRPPAVKLEDEPYVVGLQAELNGARAEIELLREEAAALRAELAARPPVQVQLGTDSVGAMVPGYVPRLPWTVISAVHVEGRVVHAGLSYDQDGRQRSFDVREIRVERTGGNRPKIMVNNAQVRFGDMYVDGKLRARACADDRSIEVG